MRRRCFMAHTPSSAKRLVCCVDQLNPPREADVPQKRQKLLFGALPFCRFGGARRRGDRMKLDIPFMDTKGPLQLKPPAILAVATLERKFGVGPGEEFRSRRGVGVCPLPLMRRGREVWDG